uniref:Uncharacterized protein n=1 Tax=Siphoviridae sp. ctOCb13 TaxID=2825477 RepID=A0A8S5Q1X2_9CAUD|nr:MAG TPA: hypothetical protein [Siphoviridae sp. ctOCb13]
MFRLSCSGGYAQKPKKYAELLSPAHRLTFN